MNIEVKSAWLSGVLVAQSGTARLRVIDDREVKWWEMHIIGDCTGSALGVPQGLLIEADDYWYAGCCAVERATEAEFTVLGFGRIIRQPLTDKWPLEEEYNVDSLR